MPTDTRTGMTVREFASVYRVGVDKVRTWIRLGELRAINVGAMLCGKPRWVIPPSAQDEFEKRRAAGTPPKPKRRRKRAVAIDFFPD